MKILTLFFHDYIYSKCNHDSWSNSSMHKVFKNFLKAFNEEKKMTLQSQAPRCYCQRGV